MGPSKELSEFQILKLTHSCSTAPANPPKTCTHQTHTACTCKLLVGLTCVGLQTEIPSETHVRPDKKRNIETELHLIMDGDPQCESAPQ